METFTFSYRTIYSDLDTQYHVNSNRYFDLFESGKYLLLNNLGISNNFILRKQIEIESCQTSFKFIKQVFENSTIEVKISLTTFKDGYLSWNATMFNKESICFKINSINRVNPELLDYLNSDNECLHQKFDLFDLMHNNKLYTSEFKLRNIERNYFGKIPENISWKLFEETRWNHSKSLHITLDFLNHLNLAFFWREGEYRFQRIFEASEMIKSNIWIHKIEGLKFIYAHEILDSNNDIICSSFSTFIPVSISKGRPQKISNEILERIKDFINT